MRGSAAEGPDRFSIGEQLFRLDPHGRPKQHGCTILGDRRLNGSHAIRIGNKVVTHLHEHLEDDIGGLAGDEYR
ncbi:MAG: hypothetical protein ACRD0W_06330 [Acidimicrobiales bacterium]